MTTNRKTAPRAAKAPEREELRNPTDRERIAIAAAAAKARELPARLSLQQGCEGETLKIGPSHNDHAGWIDHLQVTFGSASGNFVDQSIMRIANAINTNGDAHPSVAAMNGALALLAAIAPRDELEAAIGEQILASHYASIDFLRRARVNAGEYRDTAVAYGNLATKLSRTMAVQVEALAKLRNGGKQTVEVVYVDARGGRNNIIAGPLRTHEGGGRDGKLPQSHGRATLPGVAASPMPQVWCEEQARDTVSGAGDEG
jgi:hypothetical protein